jgi:competence protein ComEA
VNIITATMEEPEALNGISPVKVRAIIDYHTFNDRFDSLADVSRLNGIGGPPFDSIKGDLRLTGATKLPSNAAALTKDDKTAKAAKETKAARPAN